MESTDTVVEFPKPSTLNRVSTSVRRFRKPLIVVAAVVAGVIIYNKVNSSETDALDETTND